MIICAFENSPSIPSFLMTKIVYIGYGQLKKIALFLLPFHSCAPCIFISYCCLWSGSVLLLYASAHKLSLKYPFPEQMFIEICCQKCQKCNTICVTTCLAHLTQRSCEVLPSLGVRRPSVNFSYFNLLL